MRPKPSGMDWPRLLGKCISSLIFSSPCKLKAQYSVPRDSICRWLAISDKRRLNHAHRSDLFEPHRMVNMAESEEYGSVLEESVTILDNREEKQHSDDDEDLEVRYTSS